MTDLALVDAFTRTPGHGNRAAVVLDASGLTTEEMAAIAAAAPAPETAFGVPSRDPADHDLEVRYFTRTRELPLCGHATIAFHYLRALRYDLGSGVIRVKTGAGVLPVEIDRDGGEPRVTMTQAAPRVLATPDPAAVAEVLVALGLSEDDLVPGLPIEVVTTGHAKVLVPIRSIARLDTLRPDRGVLVRLSPFDGANGFFVFALEPRGDALYHGRMFAPATGVDEDPATGNANGPAGFYLYRHGTLRGTGVVRYTAVQGVAMGRPSRIEVILDVVSGDVSRVRVAGEAVMVATFSTGRSR